MVQRFHNNSPFRSILVLSIAPFLLFCLVGSLSNTFLLDDQVVLSDLEGNPHVFDEVGGSFVGHGNFSAFQAGDVVLSEDGTSLVLSSGLVNSMTVCPPGGAISNCRITNNGLLEDPIFLSYFPMVLATLLLGRNLGKGMEVLVDATSENFVLIEPDGGSTLSVKDESNLRTIQNAIIDNISWWPSSSDIHSLRSLFSLALVLGSYFSYRGRFST